MVLVVGVVLCVKTLKLVKNSHESKLLLLTEFRIVDRVEEDHGTNAHLGKWGNANFLRLHVLMLPAPETCRKDCSGIIDSEK